MKIISVIVFILPFVQLKIDLFSFALRGIDISSFFCLLIIIYKISNIRIDKNISIILLFIFFSLFSFYYPLIFEKYEHFKNILTNSLRYLQIGVLIYFIFKFNILKSEYIINCLFFAVFLNNIFGGFLYYQSLTEYTDDKIKLIYEGRFVYNYRYGFSIIENSPNVSGSFLLSSLPVVINFIKFTNKYIKPVVYIIFSYHIILLLITGSKVSYFGLVLIALYYMVLHIRKRPFVFFIYVPASLILLYILSKVVPHHILYRFNSFLEGDESTMERITRFYVGLNIFHASPVFGYGYSNTYSLLFEQFSSGNMKRFLRGDLGAHNSFINMLVSTGILGFLNMCTYIIEVLRKNLDYKSTFFASFILLLFSMTTDDIYFNPLGQYLFFLLGSCLYYKV